MSISASVQNKSPGHACVRRSIFDQLSIEMNIIEDENSILRQIIASSSDPILITDTSANITYVNPAWERLTGYTLKEVEGKNPSILKSEKTPRGVYKKMWKALSQGKQFSSNEVINKKKNGKEYSIYSDIYPVFQNNDIQYYVQLQHDITKEKELDELRKEFLSASAHELKTPITVLKLLIQSHIKKGSTTGKDTIKIQELELFDKELDKIVRLINDLLDSARLETGKQFISFENTELIDLIRITIAKISIYSKKHTFIFNSNVDSIQVIADPIRIEQVLLNLLSNAVKYSPDGSEITINVAIKDNSVITSVTDQGMGIPRKMHSLIFDRYFQVKTRSKSGFGLGLYISKEIVKRHKGKIWVKSKPGEGSTFSFSLPIYQ